MSSTDVKSGLDESQVIDLFLQKKVISEAQLKAALDFKKSIGGSVVDVLFKLGLIRSTNISEVLSEAAEESEEREEDTRESNAVLDPAEIDMAELKLHHRLLDKLPAPLVDEFLLLLFFPVSSVCSRKLIVGHGKMINNDVMNKVRSLLGVEICSLSLPEAAACDFLNQYDERSGGGKPKRVPSGGSPAAESAAEAAIPEPVPEPTPPAVAVEPVEPPPAPAVSAEREPETGGEGTDQQLLLKALIGLLVKKGVMTKQELQVEYELLRVMKH